MGLSLSGGLLDLACLWTIRMEYRPARVGASVRSDSLFPVAAGLMSRCLGLGAILGFVINYHQEYLYEKRARKSATGRAPPEARLYYAAYVGLAFPLGLYGFAWTGRPDIQCVLPSTSHGHPALQLTVIVGSSLPSSSSSAIAGCTTCMWGFCESGMNAARLSQLIEKPTDSAAITWPMRTRHTVPVLKPPNPVSGTSHLPSYHCSPIEWSVDTSCAGKFAR